MGSMISHSQLQFDQNDIDSVIDLLRTGQVATGQAVTKLESQLEDAWRSPVACVSSGTAALHLTLLAMGFHSGSRVAIPSFICPSVKYCLDFIGAISNLYDCNPLGLGLDQNSFSEAIDHSDCAIIPHTFGFVTLDVTKWNRLLPCIEDCAQACGARDGNKTVGTSASAGIHSFYATKMIGSGDGGAVSARQEIIDWIRDRSNQRGHDDLVLRYPYSMSNLHAVLITSRFQRIDKVVATRKQLATNYISAFRDLPIQFPDPESPSVWYRFPIQTSIPREILIKQAMEKGIGLGYGVKTPLHRLLNLNPSRFINSESAFRFLVLLPLYPGLSESDQSRIIDLIRSISLRTE